MRGSRGIWVLLAVAAWQTVCMAESDIIEVFVEPRTDDQNTDPNAGRKLARHVGKATDMEELMTVFKPGRDEVVVGFFDPPLNTEADEYGEMVQVRKMRSDDKYPWWHKICHNNYNKEMSFVVTSEMSLAYYFGMYPMPNKPASLFFAKEEDKYVASLVRFFDDGQIQTPDPSDRREIGLLVPDIFQPGGWRFEPTEKHAERMSMLNEHLRKLKEEEERFGKGNEL